MAKKLNAKTEKRMDDGAAAHLCSTQYGARSWGGMGGRPMSSRLRLFLSLTLFPVTAATLAVAADTPDQVDPQYRHASPAAVDLYFSHID